MTDKWHWLRHKWTKWSPYIQEYDLVRRKDGAILCPNTCQLRQQRKCLVCGSIQDKPVADTSQILPQFAKTPNQPN